MTPSRTNTINLALVGLGVLLLGAHWLLQRDPTQRHRELITDMVDGHPLQSFSKTSLFADQRAMREPPPGTESRPSALVARVQAAALEKDQGQALFERACALCHGSDAQGKGMIVQRGFPPPPSLTSTQTALRSDEELLRIIVQGFGNMPPQGAILEPWEREQIVRYIRKIQNR